MERIMDMVEKYIELEAELEFQTALKESSNVLELQKKEPSSYQIYNSIQSQIDLEIRRRFHSKVKEYIHNIKL